MRRSRLIAFKNLLLIMLLLAISACTPKYVSLTKQGDTLLQKGDKDGAQKRYEAAVKSSPKYAPALYRLGRLTADKGDWRLADQYLTAAVVADPQMPEAIRYKGEASLRLGRLEDAGRELRKSRELGAKGYELSLGIYGYLSQDYELAYEALTEAVQQDAQVLAAVPYVLKAALASGALPPALNALEKAKVPEKAADAALIHRVRVDLLYLSKDYGAALSALSKAQEKAAFGFWFREPSQSLLNRLGAVRGAVVEYVHLGSPAARNGLLPGDIVTSFERKPIRSAAELNKQLELYRKKPTHDEVLLEVFRDGQQMAFRLTPDAFQTRQLIEQTQEGREPTKLSQAPDGDLLFP
ncbi:MAG: tetratricopeptide repeat protein [Myxococcota bacterium]